MQVQKQIHRLRKVMTQVQLHTTPDNLRSHLTFSTKCTTIPPSQNRICKKKPTSLHVCNESNEYITALKIFGNDGNRQFALMESKGAT